MIIEGGIKLLFRTLFGNLNLMHLFLWADIFLLFLGKKYSNEMFRFQHLPFDSFTF